MTANHLKPQNSLAAGILPWLLTLALALPMFWLQADVAEHRQSNNSNVGDEALLTATDQLPSFGYQNLVADFLWLRFVQYFGDYRVREKTGYSLNHAYLTKITNRNPCFWQAYLMSNLAVAYKMGRPDLADSLLLKGLSLDPDDYTLWQTRGFLHYLYTGDTAKAVYSFQKTAGNAVAKGGNSQQRYGNYWLSMSRYIAVSKNNPWTRRGMWREVYINAAENETRTIALKQLKALGVILQADGQLKELYPLYPPKGFAKQFAYGPPYPYHR